MSEQWWPKSGGSPGGGSGGGRQRPSATTGRQAGPGAGRRAAARSAGAPADLAGRSGPRPAHRPPQAYVRSFLGGGGPRGRFTGGRGLAFIAVGRGRRCGSASGVYRVQPDEQGVVLRFGAFDRTHIRRA